MKRDRNGVCAGEAAREAPVPAGISRQGPGCGVWAAGLAVCFCLLVLAGCGRAGVEEPQDTYPMEAVELIAPAGPGSGYDLTMRMVSQCLKNTGLVPVPLPVTDKPGEGGGLALEYLSQEKGKDNILSIFSPPLCLINLNGGTRLNYKEHTTPVARLVVDYGCLAVRADSPYGNLQEVMDQLKKDPGSIRIGGTSSYGSMDHIQFLKIARAAGVGRLDEVQYEGFENGGAAAQLMGRRVDLLSVGISDVVGLVESGDIRALAVTSRERLEGSVISQIPTCMEQGIDAEFSNWRGLFGPQDMPEYAVAYWEETFRKMVETKEWQEICRKYGWTMDFADHEAFGVYLDQVNEEYKVLLKEVGLGE